MKVPTVTIDGRPGARHAVFIRWSGQTNDRGSRVTDWMPEAGAEQIARILRGALADAYHAGRAAEVDDQGFPMRPAPLLNGQDS